MLVSVSAIYGLCLTVIACHTYVGRKDRIQNGVSITGRVVDVLNGNTFVLAFRDRYLQIHLSGLCEPPSDSPWHDVAAWALVGKLHGRKVQVDIHAVSSRASAAGSVYCDGRDVRLEMVREGHGSIDPAFSTDVALIIAEHEAQRMGVGQWRSAVKLAALDQKSLGCKDKSHSARR